MADWDGTTFDCRIPQRFGGHLLVEICDHKIRVDDKDSGLMTANEARIAAYVLSMMADYIKENT